ncbi:TIGR03915 family putative DNA repair protein [Arcobacter sp. CECT 8985]|uniref:TIGR03915 family putative DNA repair protein n=1 Tax=Arcobacter sp. CECT 8985 TaxID=1935424 RepID=UPI00100C0C4F|nr:TIGR03915 family putative DNA repair protein [Arcobacter sp. CECT 8985]RXJ86532.1 DNA metabolism protein [Arcobacter sp. CECT 8985]
MILIYDNSFEGFLTLVYDVYYKKLKPNTILKQKPNILILEELLEIKTDEKKASKVLESIKKHFSKNTFHTILNIFMCDNHNFELHLLNFIILGFRNKKELSNINNSSIFFIQNLEKQLFSAKHKMTGFLRFEELEDKTLYAKIQSQFNLSYFLGIHFYKRLNNQNYIIHDINRKLAFIKNENFLGVQSIASFEQPTLSKNEQKFKKLWSSFFQAVTIESRKNVKLQKNLVPLLYRTYMTEFQS